jgi:serine/threonine protein kinase
MSDQESYKPPPLPHRRSERPSVESGETAAAQSPPPHPHRRSERPPVSTSVELMNRGPRVPASEPPGTLPTDTGPEQAVRPSSELPNVDPQQLWEGKIRVAGQLGRGGMSYVLRGTDTTLKRELALKVSPLPRKQLPRSQLARFIEEAQITAQLEHPNVVPVHEIGLDPEGRVYFTMKLVRGQSLEEILEKRRQGEKKTLSEFGLRRLLDVFLQVCQAMEYVHARGVVHRDLKPANIMVGDFGEVLLMDWGVAKVVGRPDRPGSEGISVSPLESDENGRLSADRASTPPPMDVTSVRAGKRALQTQSGTVIGTPAYMSPEQARGLPVNERSDIYALGVILFEILCGRLPFDDEDPTRLLAQMLSEKPPRPSEFNPATPLALETLALRLLEKDVERRTLTIAQIRTHVQNYIEGVGRDYRPESLWGNALWVVGAMSVFAFLVWYLTGQTIGALFVLAPATVFNAVGWFLVVLAFGCPLWAGYLAFRRRPERDRFQPASSRELFVSSYLAHRTFAATVAPVFQLIFIVELVSLAIAQATRGRAQSADVLQQITGQVRGEWAQSLIVILIFLFGYLFLLSSEVRFARRIDRYELLVDRPRWEGIWPFFLILLLLLTLGTTDVLDWAFSPGGPSLVEFLRRQMLTQPLDLIDIVKTLVFQGTFLLGLVICTVLLAFPVAEVLAALRLSYQPADEASVQSRAQYFLRSVAIFRVARANWLYAGAMIGGLTAITVLSQRGSAPLLKQILYILGPSLIGFIGYSVTRRHVRSFLDNAPAVARLLDSHVERFQRERARVNEEVIAAAPWRHRLLQLVVPIGCIAAYLIWTGSGIHQQAIQSLVMPVTAKGWLLILPYALLLPVLLVRDHLQLWSLRRRAARVSNPVPAASP